jgi:transcriptional regulator with XRE-family HTH domain
VDHVHRERNEPNMHPWCTQTAPPGSTAAVDRPHREAHAVTVVGRWTGQEASALRQALRLTIRDFAEHLGVAERTVAKWEAGGSAMVPVLLMQAALDTVLERASDEAKGRFGILLAAAWDPAGSAGSGVTFGGSRRAERMLRLSEETANNLAAVTASYRRMYHTVDAHDLIDGVAQHVRTTRAYWRRTTDPELRPSLAAITSQTAMLAGRMSFFDLGRPSQAEPYYQTALEAAEGAGDRALQAVALGTKSFIARDRGDFDGSLHLLRQAQELTADQPMIRSWATALEAMTHSWAHQPNQSVAAMEQAEALLDQARADDRPTWFDYYDAARLAGFQGLMLIRLGDPETAQTLLDAAIKALPSQAAKQRACYLADQAMVNANAGEVEAACQLGSQALGILDEVEYATGVQRVRDLHSKLRPHWNHPAVADLTEQLLLVS